MYGTLAGQRDSVHRLPMVGQQDMMGMNLCCNFSKVFTVGHRVPEQARLIWSDRAFHTCASRVFAWGVSAVLSWRRLAACGSGA